MALEGEPTTVVLLNGHDVNLLFEYLSLCPFVSSAVHLGQKAGVRSSQYRDSQLFKVLRSVLGPKWDVITPIPSRKKGWKGHKNQSTAMRAVKGCLLDTTWPFLAATATCIRSRQAMITAWMPRSVPTCAQNCPGINSKYFGDNRNKICLS